MGEDEASDVFGRRVVVRGVVVVRGIVIGGAVTRLAGAAVAGTRDAVGRTVARWDVEPGREGVATRVVGTSKPGISPPGAGRPGISPFPVGGTATIGPLLVWDSPIRMTVT